MCATVDKHSTVRKNCISFSATRTSSLFSGLCKIRTEVEYRCWKEFEGSLDSHQAKPCVLLGSYQRRVGKGSKGYLAELESFMQCWAMAQDLWKSTCARAW